MLTICLERERHTILPQLARESPTPPEKAEMWKKGQSLVSAHSFMYSFTQHTFLEVLVYSRYHVLPELTKINMILLLLII